ncbi:EamA family transporter [Gordonia asplenii]|uniref:EamA family transporter n=1 Tax=Gordonia asplenii TaxID=2725283 RepID=UPI0028B054A2|nr:EamA family transporter [Gordonia asplenii]
MTASPAANSHASPSSVLLILGSCTSLQFGAALAAQLFDDLGSWGVTVLRLGLAAVALVAVTRPSIRRWTRRQWLGVALFGLAMAGMNGFFYAAIARIPLGTAVAIEFLGPLVLAAVLSRKRADIVCVALAAAGMALLGVESLVGDDPLDPVGVCFVLLAAASWAGYIVTSARVGQRVPGAGGLAMAMVVGTLAVLPMGLPGAVVGLTDPHLLGLAALTALLASIIPYSLEFAALRRMPRHVFGVLMSLEPVVAALAGWLILDQRLGLWRSVAICLVVAASVGAAIANRPRGPRRRQNSAADDDHDLTPDARTPTPALPDPR